MNTQTFAFANKLYAAAPAPPMSPEPKPIAISVLGNPELVTLFNLVQSNLGGNRVMRFKDNKTAQKRTLKALEEYAATVAAEEAAGDVSPTPAPAATPAAKVEAAPKAPRVLKRRDARRLKDGSYHFDILPRVPRTTKISAAREELLGYLLTGEATWAGIVAHVNASLFVTVTSVTTFCITLGYGLKTQEDGTIKLLEPLSA